MGKGEWTIDRKLLFFHVGNGVNKDQFILKKALRPWAKWGHTAPHLERIWLVYLIQ